MCLRLLAAISILDVRTAHYYDLLSGLIRDYLQDMQYSCNMSPLRASLLQKTTPACRCLTIHIRCVTIPFVSAFAYSCFVDTALLPDGYPLSFL